MPSDSRDIAALSFSGGRFEAIGFPLDGIDELQRYQRLVLEAAKKIWWDAHPDAKKLPDHFADRVRLRLTEVHRGSVIPVIEREAALESFPGQPDLMELSIQYVDETFESIIGRLEMPRGATEGLVNAARSFGRSFEGSEKATFRSGSDHPLLFTIERRDAFLHALALLQKPVEGTLIGTLRMLDASNSFILLDAHGRRIEGKFSQGALFKDLHEVHKKSDEADLVWLSCVFLARVDDGTVVKIEDVSDAGLFAKSTNRWAAPLSKLAAYREGWLDGEGKRIDIASLVAALRVLDELGDKASTDQIGTPSIFGDIEGGVRLEWLGSTSHTMLSIDTSAVFSGYHLDAEAGTEAWIDNEVRPDIAIKFVRVNAHE
jgi:hypothetical protein